MATMKSFVEVGSGSQFPIQNLPYGVFRPSAGAAHPRPGVAIGDFVVDLSVLTSAGLFNGPLLKGSDCLSQVFSFSLSQKHTTHNYCLRPFDHKQRQLKKSSSAC